MDRGVDPAGDRLLVNCGQLPDSENGATPSKTIEADVTDAVGNSAAAFVRVSLVEPLSAPELAKDLRGKPRLVVYRTRFTSAWTRGVARTDISAQAPYYLHRWRQAGSSVWQYSVVPRREHGSQIHPTTLHVREVGLWELPSGTSYEVAVSALRHELEVRSPDALSWSDVVGVTTLMNPQNVRVAATHDTLTVSWDAQPDGRRYVIDVSGPEGTKQGSLSADRGSTGRHEVVLRGLPADTAYRVGVQSAVLSDAVRTEVTARTTPAPPGAVELPRGPKNVRVASTGNEILVSWDPPHLLAERDYFVFLWHPERVPGVGNVRDSVHVSRDDPTIVRFSNLRPQTAYRVKVVHNGILHDSVEQTVRTTATDSARLKAGEVPIPFGGSQVKLIWPLWFDPQYFLTADAWIWRSSSTDSRFHAGLDVGHRGGAASIRGDDVNAAADGVLRIFNHGDPKEESRRYVQYCPPGAGSPTPAKAKFPFHFRSASEHELTVNGSLVCNYVASPASGRTALIFHGAMGAGPLVTKYAHLATVDSKLLAKLQANASGAIEVRQGDRIGTVGGSGQSNDSDYHAHLHFEVREFSGKVERTWYTYKNDCNPEVLQIKTVMLAGNDGKLGTDDDETLRRGYCGWSDDRELPTVLDPESVLPPLPAASQPTGALGQSVDASATPAFALRSAYPAGLSPTKLRLNLQAEVWRPRFYDRVSDPEFVDPSANVKGRNDLTGTAGTRPGVTGYQPHAGDCLAPGSALPSSSIDEGTYTFLLELKPGASCSVSIKTTNESYPSGYDGFAHPEATLSLTNLVGGQSVRTIKATLDGYDFDLYQFRAMPGQAHTFCAILNDDGDCSERTAGQPVAGKDTVLEIWSAAGVVAHDRRDGESEIVWTPSINQIGLHYLLVRGKHAVRWSLRRRIHAALPPAARSRGRRRADTANAGLRLELREAHHANRSVGHRSVLAQGGRGCCAVRGARVGGRRTERGRGGGGRDADPLHRAPLSSSRSDRRS
ncbi:MAG: peptidoglycan DD-metalloendopeptidase family protein [Chloroflexi bacterium]|nr:peptidoglycan DD-metalloendopeptidase family protein [Chloroflexota bacterium]MYF82494.1 peptidoglycan DD-metalloendopeptidase family protein [Chloroflexota bacterium]MYI03273.1 peptidoglycan DD-metalloendopeptidase family protein [Chloroflexota bacterium]